MTLFVLFAAEMNSLLQSNSGSTSARDRTNEFMTTIRSLQGQQLGRNGGFNQQIAPQDRHGQLGKKPFFDSWLSDGNIGCITLRSSCIMFLLLLVFSGAIKRFHEDCAKYRKGYSKHIYQTRKTNLISEAKNYSF